MAPVAWLSVWMLFAATAAAPQAPIRKVDRMRVVGGPVLEADTRPGIYVWVEDGYFQLAAVGVDKRRSVLRVTVETTSDMSKIDLGDFRATTMGPRRMVLEARVQKIPAKARFQSAGELLVSEAIINTRMSPIFVGPLSDRAAARLRIGRY